MLQITQNYKTGALSLEEVPPPTLKQNGILVRTCHSLISAGTERMKIDLANKSYLGKAKAKPEQVKQVVDVLKKEGLANTYRKVMGKLDSLTPLGYSCAGEVIDIAPNVTEFQIGDRVACAGAGFANHAEVNFIPKNLCCKIPENVTSEQAAFATVGAIALQGVRQSEVKLGETVAVVGLGLLGQLTVQLLNAVGCKVLGIDLDPYLTALAQKNGAVMTGVSGKDDIIQLAQAISDGHGVDAVIITAATPSSEPVNQAGKMLRKKGKVIIVGAVGLNVPRDPDYYQKELDLRLSCSYGPGRYDPVYEEQGIDYPIGYVRWTEKRNMQAFLELMAQKKIDLTPIITHRFKFEQALQAYELVQGKTEERYLGILLEYETANEIKSRIRLNPAHQTQPKSKDKVGISFIGAGSFAKSMLLPNLKNHRKVRFQGISTATGITAKDIGQKYGFEFCTADAAEIVQNEQTDCVFIATRHNTHGKYVVESLRQNKHVFVEKPLAMNLAELAEIQQVFEKSGNRQSLPVLMAGFNRRFSPLAEKVKQFYQNRKSPLVVTIRVNAGFIPKTHWTQNAEEGGGRIIGEVCHFIDLIQYFTDSLPVRVYAESTVDSREDVTNHDQVTIVLKYQDGSMGTIHYLANGDKSYPKEYIEVFGENRIAIIDDFRTGTFVKNGKSKVVKMSQDKGHKNEVHTFVNSITNGQVPPISLESLISTTLTSFKAIESLQKGGAVAVVF